MIGKLIGLVDCIEEGFLILMVSGVGYRVFCSTKTLAKLPPLGQETSLWIETQVREDHIHLFGFAEKSEKQMFELLTTVQGVGARVALGILSVLTASEIQTALATADSKAFTRANGVGPKLGQRIVHELKNKIMGIGTEEIIPLSQHGTQVEEALSALVNLGYARSEAGIVLGKILTLNTEASVSELIKLSLKELGKSNAF